MFTRFVVRAVLGVVLAVTGGVVNCQRAEGAVYSQTFDLLIPSPNDPDSQYGKGKMLDAIIEIREHVVIADIDVAVSITHGSFYDLQIKLESPAGTAIVLNPHTNDAFMIRGPDGGIEPAGGSKRLAFDDESPAAIEDAKPPFDVPYKPCAGYKLSAFDGQDAFGQWRVQIYDMWDGHSGRLEGAELIVNVPEPGTAALLLLSLGILRAAGAKRCNRG